MRCYLTVVLICISLMISDVEHLFMCRPSVCRLWKKCLFSSSAHFFNWVFFLMLSCMISLYILDINFLSDTLSVNIFSQLVDCLFKKLFIYLFMAVLGLVAARRLSLVAVSRGYSSLWCVGFSLQWLLLLWSTGSRYADFSSCGSQALERSLSSCGSLV